MKKDYWMLFLPIYFLLAIIVLVILCSSGCSKKNPDNLNQPDTVLGQTDGGSSSDNNPAENDPTDIPDDPNNQENPGNTVSPKPSDKPPVIQNPDAEYDWNLILVNKEHPLENEIDMNLSKIYGDYSADSRIVDAFNNMSNAAKDDGINLVVHSAYRSISKQEYLFNRKVNQYLNKGYSDDNAKSAALSIVAYPGQSEHHTGLCLDITSSEWLSVHGNDPLITDFRDSESGKWLKENAKNYGFILRYPEDKEDITGYSFEPWHYRYVGTEHSIYIMDNNLTLEEYLQSGQHGNVKSKCEKN